MRQECIYTLRRLGRAGTSDARGPGRAPDEQAAGGGRGDRVRRVDEELGRRGPAGRGGRPRWPARAGRRRRRRAARRARAPSARRAPGRRRPARAPAPRRPGRGSDGRARARRRSTGRRPRRRPRRGAPGRPASVATTPPASAPPRLAMPSRKPAIRPRSARGSRFCASFSAGVWTAASTSRAPACATAATARPAVDDEPDAEDARPTSGATRKATPDAEAAQERRRQRRLRDEGDEVRHGAEAAVEVGEIGLAA